MVGVSGLPAWQDRDALWTVATSLREAVFTSQAQAARHFGMAHTTISRYESYESAGVGTKPPLGYLAALAEMLEQRVAGEQGAADGARAHLVQQLEKVRKRFYAEEPSAPWRTWTDLCRSAASYRASRLLKVPHEPPARPRSLYAWLDGGVYAGLAALAQGDSALLRECLVLAGLGLGTWPLLSAVFALPADPADQVALARGALGIVLATTILPLLLGGGTMLLALGRRPEWRGLDRRAAGALALMAYGGAGFGVLMALAGLGLMTLLIHAAGWTAAWLAAGLRGATWLAVLALGVVCAGRSMDVYARYRTIAPGRPGPGLTWGDTVIGLAAPVAGLGLGLLLWNGYDLLLDAGTGPSLVAAALLGVVIAGMRRTAARPSGDPPPRAPGVGSASSEGG